MAKKNEQNEVETTTNGEATENATRQVVSYVTVDAVATGDAKSSEVEAGAPPKAAPEVEADDPAKTGGDPAGEAEAPTEAGANPVGEAVTAAMGEVVPKKQSRKAKLSSAAKDEIAAAPDCAAYGLLEEDASKVEALASPIPDHRPRAIAMWRSVRPARAERCSTNRSDRVTPGHAPEPTISTHWSEQAVFSRSVPRFSDRFRYVQFKGMVLREYQRIRPARCLRTLSPKVRRTMRRAWVAGASGSPCRFSNSPAFPLAATFWMRDAGRAA